MNSQDILESDGSELSEDGKRIVAAIREELKKVKAEFVEQINRKNEQIEVLSKEVNTLKE